MTITPLDELVEKAWDAKDHPRDSHGRFKDLASLSVSELEDRSEKLRSLAREMDPSRWGGAIDENARLRDEIERRKQEDADSRLKTAEKRVEDIEEEMRTFEPYDPRWQELNRKWEEAKDARLNAARKTAAGRRRYNVLEHP